MYQDGKLELGTFDQLWKVQEREKYAQNNGK